MVYPIDHIVRIIYNNHMAKVRRKRKLKKLLSSNEWEQIMEQVKGLDDMENGYPYWYYMWNIDEATGDGWRLVRK